MGRMWKRVFLLFVFLSVGSQQVDRMIRTVEYKGENKRSLIRTQVKHLDRDGWNESRKGLIGGKLSKQGWLTGWLAEESTVR